MCLMNVLIKLDLLARINESRGPSSRRQNNEKRQRGKQVKHDLCNNMICSSLKTLYNQQAKRITFLEQKWFGTKVNRLL